MKKTIGVALAAIALVFGLTACGGYDDSEYSDPGTSQVEENDGGFSY